MHPPVVETDELRLSSPATARLGSLNLWESGLDCHKAEGAA